MKKQNKIKLFNCSPTYYAFYKGINYGMSSNTKLQIDGITKEANTIDESDGRNSLTNYCWDNYNAEGVCFPIELYLYAPNIELTLDYDYVHFRGMTADGIIGGQYTNKAKVEISADKHYAKISFPNYYGVTTIWNNTTNNCTTVILNKLCNQNPDKWMKGYFEILNPVTQTTHLTLGSGWLKRLSAETIKIATDKGWTLA